MFPGGIQAALLVKLDECGCIEPGCNSACYDGGYSQQAIHFPKVEIYPNPASEYIQISAPISKGTLRVYNTQGQLCIEKDYKSESIIDITHLPNSTYTINYIGEGQVCIGKFVK